MYGNYGFGGESDESILRRGPVCGTSPGFADKARWGLREASNAWTLLAMVTVGIGPLVVAPWAGKLFMKDASYRKRLLVTNAAILLGLTLKNFGAGEGSWRRACENERSADAFRQTDEYRRLVQKYIARGEDPDKAHYSAMDQTHLYLPRR